jgi:polysaccharide biosynthesis/export protein
MNNFTQPRDIHFTLPALAAGALFVVLATIATAANAQAGKPTARLAVVSPSNAPAAAQVQPQPLPPSDSLQASSASLESVGPGDMLRINVFRNPDLNTEARVTPQGTILFPLIGDVRVSGMSPQQVGNLIADKLRAGKYVVNPEVSVSMAQVNSRQVSVLGNVTRPGRYPIDNVNSKLTDFIAAAGGVAAPGSDTVTVLSNQDGKAVKVDVDLAQMFREGNLANNMALHPGDTIFVHRAPVVYVYGEVQKAGAYRLEPKMTVMQAIAMGGGLTPRGTERGIRIHRRSGEQVAQREAKLTDIVQSDDVIYVRESLF